MQTGEIIYKTPAREDAVNSARKFCKVRKLGPDDVRLVKREGQIMVIVKRECQCYVPK